MRLELKATDLEEEKEELQTRLNEQEDQTTACQQVRRRPLLEFNLCHLAKGHFTVLNFRLFILKCVTLTIVDYVVLLNSVKFSFLKGILLSSDSTSKLIDLDIKWNIVKCMTIASILVMLS